MKMTLTADGATRDQSITVCIAGITVPSMGRKGVKNEDGTEQTPEPFAIEAKHFTEMSLLHRGVRAILEGWIEGIISSGPFFRRTSTMPSSSTSGKFMSTRSGAGARGERGGHDRRRVQASPAEKAAKEQQLRIWRGYVPPVSSINSMTVKTFDARVVEIISGDCISVVPTSGQDVSERRINLSSIRAPRISNSRDERRVTNPGRSRQRSS